jgi:Zn-dependent membrane protease YugP
MPVMYYGFDMLGYGLVVIGAVITIAAQVFLTRRYNKFKNVRSTKGMTGCEVARKILDENGLSDIYVTEVSGTLSDHYDPTRKVVRLSEEIFHGDSIASISVAAHECGHAIQHKEGYFFIKLRGFLVPFVNFASKFGYIAIFIGLLLSWLDLAWAGIGLLLMLLVFQLITLPTEFNASKRALEILKMDGVLDDNEVEGSRKMLTAAALTYVAGLASTILELLRLVLIVSNRDDR